MSKSQSVAPEGRPSHGVKIRVHGVKEGSPAHQRVLDNLQGSIGQFLRKNQQQVALSGHEQYASRKKVPGASLRYKNNQGQETLDVVVEHEEGGEEKVEENPEYWQWAIVETTIPDMTKTGAELAAFMNPKLKNKIGIAQDNVFNYDDYDLKGAPLRYPGLDGPAIQMQVIGGQSDQVSSLLVDMRPYPGGVKFDLYGYIHSYIDPDNLGPIVGSTFRAARGANQIPSGSWTGTWHSTNGLLSGAYPSSADISGRTQTDVYYANTLPSLVNDDFPETVGLPFNHTTMSTLNFLFAAYGAFGASGPAYTGIEQTWTAGSGNGPNAASVSGLMGAAGGLFTETTSHYAEGPVSKVRGIGAMDYYRSGGTVFPLNGAGPDDSRGSYGIDFFDYTLYHTSDHSALTVYPDRHAPVKFSVFDGKEPDGFTRLDGVSGGFGSCRRWESQERGLGKRWPFKQIAVANIKSIDAPIDTSIENHFGMVKLGTVIINPRKGKGGIKFIAA